ncbi:chitin synthase activator [Apiospora kogelbergensis]|uniref:Chitin synthase activator n=1 Tax=Apiospora kogelbergensis TaxID=1337665 RepID=A0AAW0RCX7_9PEZI
MAYPGAQRPYAGMAAQRPAPRGGGGGGGAYPGPPRQQFDQYQEDYGYEGGFDDYNDGYGPPQAGTMDEEVLEDTRKTIMDRHRAGQNAVRSQGPIMSPQERDFGGSSYPAFPGQKRVSDLDEESRILDSMAEMSLNGPGPGPGPGGNRPQQRRPTMEDYGGGGRPSMDSQRGGPRGPPPRGYPDPRRGPPGPHKNQDMADTRMMGMRAAWARPSKTIDSTRKSAAASKNVPESRAARTYETARTARAPGPPGQFDQGYDYQAPQQAWGNEPTVRASFGDFYDAYYNPRDSEQYQPQDPRGEIPDFDAAPDHGPRASFDQHMQAGPPAGMAQQNGPMRFPEINRTKSQPNLREPQAAVFEMAAEMPPVPNGGFQAYNGGPPGTQGMPPHPQAGPGGGHPAPIRPGLMPNSMVNMNDKPPPMRQYNGPPPAAIGAQGRPPPQPMQNGPPEPIPVTVEELERLRAVIKSDPNDQGTALILAKKLVEAADVLVPRLPDPKARARSRERYVVDAHKILKKLVSAQNSDAMFFLADCQGRGTLGFEPDNKEAFTLYQSAAKLGHAAAAYRTAVCCEIGHDEGGGTRKDPLKAIQWYKRAATLGDTPAMYKVGMILLKGLLGQPRNPREAVGWLKRAAERADAENPHALHELGLLYESAQPNDTILRDEPYAFSLFEQAADLGYKFSQFRMGCAFEYGLMGCPVDPRMSIMWYSRAATQEEHQSELALSGWYLTGSDGVLQQSDTEAYLWARKAAQAGLAKAEYAMGYFTEVGIGVPANMEDAKRWYWRAAAQDFPKARERLEDLKRSGKNGPRHRERISRSNIGKQQEGECSVM